MTLSARDERESAYLFCENLARSHYENFPVASRLVPKRSRPAVAALYAFARIADDFADEPAFNGERLQRLDDWRRQLHAMGRKPAEHPVFTALEDTISNFNLPLEPFDDLLSAFRQDVEKNRYATFKEVLDYCRRSANPVGRLVLMLCGYRRDDLSRLSDSICTALQLANFWQDLAVDLKKDRIYIPQEDFKAYGYSEADLRMGVVNEKFRQLMRQQCKRTRAIFEDGRPLAGKLSWPLSWEIRLTWLGGMEILRRVRKSGFDTLSKRPVLTKWDWIPLFLRSLA